MAPQKARSPREAGFEKRGDLAVDRNGNSALLDAQDVAREQRIDRLTDELLRAIEQGSDERHFLNKRRNAEIAARSPVQIYRMELERGLRPAAGRAA